jgi:hypothetical protein
MPTERRSLAVSRAERRRGKTKKMAVVAIALMLLALVGYVLSMDEELAPGGDEERMVGE